jgi:hypothetical protein
MVKAIEKTAITGEGAKFAAGKSVFVGTQQVVFSEVQNLILSC